ncbi:unnamed protein product [Caenorhabditis angaria]|uniref:NR LBD domain-containing protein n=1 Tax=Caenorhabditis angaria TaxID=860376 RepID=A0A9P1IUX6_9PELO|nr:unnamed protein product [Caenorhabditis angaria]
MTHCSICQAPAQDQHFGSTVPVCRACSAFFRRFVLSPKLVIKCKEIENCEVNYKNTKNCRACRMKKSVQPPRDKYRNNPSPPIPPAPLDPFPSTSFPPPPPRLQILYNNYSRLKKSREEVFKSSEHSPRSRNMHEMIEILRQDMKLVAKFVDDSYESNLNGFTKFERKTLFQNFFIKYMIFEPPFLGMQKGVRDFILPNGDFYDKDIGRFYTAHIKKSSKVSKESANVLFKPYWDEYQRTVVSDIEFLKLDIFEFLTISALFFWDTGLDDFSAGSVEMCHRMRSEIISEIEKYYLEVKSLPDPCVRIGQIMMLLSSLQKSFVKCQEELQMCGFYDIYQQIHVDSYQMINDSLNL